MSSLVTDRSFMSISLLVMDLGQFLLVRDWREIRKSEIPPSTFCPISRDCDELGIPNLVQVSLIKNYSLRQNARVTAFTVSESLRENLFMIGPFSTIVLFLYPLKTLGGILEHYGTLWKISGILVEKEPGVSFFPIFTVFLFLVTGGITLRFVIYYKKTFPITLNYYFAQARSFFFSPIFTVLLFLVTGDITLRFVIYYKKHFLLQRNHCYKVNTLTVNPTKWSSTLKQRIRWQQPTNCSSAFGNFVWLAQKGLKLSLSAVTAMIILKFNTQKQPYWSFKSNFVEITLRHLCVPVNLLHVFRTPFLKNTYGGLLLEI